MHGMHGIGMHGQQPQQNKAARHGHCALPTHKPSPPFSAEQQEVSQSLPDLPSSRTDRDVHPLCCRPTSRIAPCSMPVPQVYCKAPPAPYSKACTASKFSVPCGPFDCPLALVGTPRRGQDAACDGPAPLPAALRPSGFERCLEGLLGHVRGRVSAPDLAPRWAQLPVRPLPGGWGGGRRSAAACE